MTYVHALLVVQVLVWATTMWLILKGHKRLGKEYVEMVVRKDSAYSERNAVVALLARMSYLAEMKVSVTKTNIEGWSPDWHNCVYIELPSGQVSWHVHDTDMWMFQGLPSRPVIWDGHDTPTKYRRVHSAFEIPGEQNDQ